MCVLRVLHRFYIINSIVHNKDLSKASSDLPHLTPPQPETKPYHNPMKIAAVSILLGILLPCYPAFAPNRVSLLPPASTRDVTFTKYPSRNIIPSTLSARRPLLSEDDLAAPPDQKVIEAVESLGGNDVLASGEF